MLSVEPQKCKQGCHKISVVTIHLRKSPKMSQNVTRAHNPSGAYNIQFGIVIHHQHYITTNRRKPSFTEPGTVNDLEVAYNATYGWNTELLSWQTETIHKLVEFDGIRPWSQESWQFATAEGPSPNADPCWQHWMRQQKAGSACLRCPSGFSGFSPWNKVGNFGDLLWHISGILRMGYPSSDETCEVTSTHKRDASPPGKAFSKATACSASFALQKILKSSKINPCFCSWVRTDPTESQFWPTFFHVFQSLVIFSF